MTKTGGRLGLTESLTVSYNMSTCSGITSYQLYRLDWWFQRSTTSITVPEADYNAGMAGQECGGGLYEPSIGQRQMFNVQFPYWSGTRSANWSLEWHDWSYVVPDTYASWGQVGGWLESHFKTSSGGSINYLCAYDEVWGTYTWCPNSQTF